jgi:hypothetical protein
MMMEYQAAATAVFESAPDEFVQDHPKYDNRSHLLAAYESWGESANRPVEPVGEIEGQPIPAALAEGSSDRA